MRANTASLDGLGEGSETQNSLFLRNPRSVGCLGAGRRVCGFFEGSFPSAARARIPYQEEPVIGTSVCVGWTHPWKPLPRSQSNAWPVVKRGQYRTSFGNSAAVLDLSTRKINGSELVPGRYQLDCNLEALWPEYSHQNQALPHMAPYGGGSLLDRRNQAFWSASSVGRAVSCKQCSSSSLERAVSSISPKLKAPRSMKSTRHTPKSAHNLRHQSLKLCGRKLAFWDAVLQNRSDCRVLGFWV